MIILYILIAYILIVYVGIRLFVPLFGFRQNKIPTSIPESLEKKIRELDRQAKDDEDYLRLVYDYVTTRHTGNRLKTATHFWTAYRDPFTHEEGFMHCHQQNHLLRTMLVKGGRFKEDQVYARIQKLSWFIHQYLIVEVGECKMLVDPWKHHLGRGFKQIK